MNRDAGVFREFLFYRDLREITRDSVELVRFNLLPHLRARALREYWEKNVRGVTAAHDRKRRERIEKRKERHAFLKSRMPIHYRDDPAWIAAG